MASPHPPKWLIMDQLNHISEFGASATEMRPQVSISMLLKLRANPNDRTSILRPCPHLQLVRVLVTGVLQSSPWSKSLIQSARPSFFLFKAINLCFYLVLAVVFDTSLTYIAKLWIWKPSIRWGCQSGGKRADPRASSVPGVPSVSVRTSQRCLKEAPSPGLWGNPRDQRKTQASPAWWVSEFG